MAGDGFGASPDQGLEHLGGLGKTWDELDRIALAPLQIQVSGTFKVPET